MGNVFDDMKDDIPWSVIPDEVRRQQVEEPRLLRSTFKRGKRFLINAGEEHGKLVEYMRRKQHTNIVVFKEVTTGTPLYFHLGKMPPLMKGAPKKTNKQGSRLLLAMCDKCGTRIRATGFTFQKGTPLCFNEHCKAIGKPMHVEWR